MVKLHDILRVGISPLFKFRIPYDGFVYTYMYIYGGVLKWRYANSWIVYFMEIPRKKKKRTGGYPPLTEETHGKMGGIITSGDRRTVHDFLPT